MLDFVAKITRNHHEATQADIERLRQAGFSDAKILYLILWTGNFNLANTITDSMGLEYHENFSSRLSMFFTDGDETAGAAEAGAGLERAHVAALGGQPLEWLNSEPLTGFDVRGRPILVSYWDATHPNSLLAVPHLNRWHRDYGPQGLVVLAVHTAEFPTAKDAEVARREVVRLGLTCRVPLDPGYRAIAGANNRYWPAMHVIDRRGYVRFRHFGPGGDQALEHFIRRVIDEGEDAASRPCAPLPPKYRDVRWLHPMATAELYAGFRLGSHRLGAWGRAGEEMAFGAPAQPEPDKLYPAGRWLPSLEAHSLTLTTLDRGAKVHRCNFLPFRGEVETFSEIR